jgi:DNA-binding beta-propeller fold protein YncE
MMRPLNRSLPVLARVALAGALVLPALVSTPAAQTASLPVSPGNGTMYIGGYPNSIWVIDEAKAKVVETISTQIGLPRRLVMSRDRSRFYVADIHATNIEIIDVATRKSLDTLTLSGGNSRVRINAFEPDPTHSYLVAITRQYTKLQDRYDIGPAKLVTIDLKSKEVTREIPWPDNTERDNANLLFSPDGKLLYFLGTEILVFETTEFKEVGRWNLSSLETGLGQVSLSYNGFGGVDTVHAEEGYLTTTMTVEDPVQSRRLMGIARVNLNEKELDFYTIGPAAGVNFALSPDGRSGFGVESEIGRYQLWTFDLENRRVAKRQEFAGRPRMSLKTSTNGKVLYIYNAGETIDLYDADTYALLTTLHLPGDVSTGLIVLPNNE